MPEESTIEISEKPAISQSLSIGSNETTNPNSAEAVGL